MNRHEFLRTLHEIVRPRTYLEIGVSDGRGLTLSRAPSVAVDPYPQVTSEIRCDLHLVKATSDDLFARDRPLEHVNDLVDLAFIDGMHLLEYALRDFINVEQYSEWSSVIVLDDMLPRNVDEAARNRRTTAWAGDVYKMIAVLQRYRPDLRLIAVDTEPTGLLLVFGPDATSAVLGDHYGPIVAEYLTADPQPVPDQVLNRAFALPPEPVLAAPFWSALVGARASPGGGYGREDLFRDIDGLTGAPVRTLAGWAPDPGLPRVPEADPTAAAAAARKPRADIWRRAARALPILRKVPGARILLRILR